MVKIRRAGLGADEGTEQRVALTLGLGNEFARSLVKQTDTEPIDVLAPSKDGKELAVIELKRGRVSDVAIGQILRYMSFVQELDDSMFSFDFRGFAEQTEKRLLLKRSQYHPMPYEEIPNF